MRTEAADWQLQKFPSGAELTWHGRMAAKQEKQLQIFKCAAGLEEGLRDSDAAVVTRAWSPDVDRT